MKTVLVIVSLTLLSACASTPPASFYYTKDGHDRSYGKIGGDGRDDLERHVDGCNAELAHIPYARTPEPGGGLMGFSAALGDISGDMAMREQFMANCMRAQGWRKNAGHRPTN